MFRKLFVVAVIAAVSMGLYVGEAVALTTLHVHAPGFSYGTSTNAVQFPAQAPTTRLGVYPTAQTSL